MTEFETVFAVLFAGNVVIWTAFARYVRKRAHTTGH